jgi:HK97 family phage portal protein
MPIVGYPGWVDRLRNGEALNDTIDGYNSVPMLYRAVNLRCDAISSVPYRINRGETEVEWPWTQSFNQLIKETERALLLTGSAFWLKLRKGNVLTGFQALNPKTVSVHFDASQAVPGNPFAGVTFTQQFRGVTFGPWTPDDVVYFREPSMTDDVGPGLAPARVALQSAQLAHYLERFASHFFEGGAQPVTVMNLPENMDEAEFQRFKGEWGKFSGVVNAFRTAFVRSAEIKATVITPPIKDLMLPELQERVITTISMTLGVPRTMLEASAANYATADSDRQSFWRETIVPRLGLYEHVINTQLFAAIGYELVYHPDELDVMQADEASRARSLFELVQAGMPLRGAMHTLGYKNIDETMAMTEPETTTPESVPLPSEVGDNIESTATPLTSSVTVSTRSVDWALLSKKLERRIKSGRDPRCSFTSDVITDDEVKSVMARLSPDSTVSDVAMIIAEVKAVDDMTPDEKRLYRELAPKLEAHGEGWAKDILAGREVNPTLKEVITPTLQKELLRVSNQRIDRLAKDVDVPMPDSEQVTQDWLTDYMPKFNSEIDDTSARIVKAAVEQYRATPGMTINDLRALLRPAVGNARAAAITITEITRAASQATMSYQTYLASKGLNFERIWNTDADEIVCDICVPLNGLGEDEWIQMYPSGPPAHTRCRCDTSLRLVRS